jgi:hypothetical protein
VERKEVRGEYVADAHARASDHSGPDGRYLNNDMSFLSQFLKRQNSKVHFSLSKQQNAKEF